MFDIFVRIYSSSEVVKVETVKTLDEAIEAAVYYDCKGYFEVWYEKRV